MSEKIIDSWTDQSFKLSYDYYETEVELEGKKVKKELKSNLIEMSEQNIRDYISSKYIKVDEIEMEKLIKDLIILKGYKSKIEEDIESAKSYWEFFSIHFGVFAAFLSINIDISDIMRDLILAGLIFLMIKNTYDFIKKDKEDKITYGILRTLNYAISILEAIKEDVYTRPEKVCDIKESNKEIVNDKKDITKNVKSNNISESLKDTIKQQKDQTENKTRLPNLFSWERIFKKLNKIFPNNSFKLINKKDLIGKDTSYEVIYNYFTENYLKGYDKGEDTKKIKDTKKELDYDLMILKTYRDYIESIEKNNDYLINCLFALITIIGITISLKTYEKVVCFGLILIGAYFAFIFCFYIWRKTKLSGSYKIRVCNKIIYKLEDLK